MELFSLFRYKAFRKPTDGQPEITVGRTVEGTVFELVLAVVLLVSWVFIVLMVRRADAVVATHFNITGQPDAFGSATSVWLAAVMLSVTSIIVMASAYRPHGINMLVPATTPSQVLLKVRAVRVMALIMGFLPLSMTYAMIHVRPLPVLCLAALLLATLVVFSVLIHRNA